MPGRSNSDLPLPYSAVRDRSDDFAFLIIEASQYNADDIHDLPDDESTKCQELEDSCNGFAGINAVNAANPTEYKQG